jgi:succinate dehydrogenase/fumarate reductase flavoprotein subunit
LNASQSTAARQEAERYLENKPGENPWVLREELGKLMWESVGISRHGTKLKAALETIAELEKRATGMTAKGNRIFNLTWQQALDVRNLLTASELIASSALMREESRGAHFREDFPKADDSKWLGNIYVAREGAGTRMWKEGVKLEKLTP